MLGVSKRYFSKSFTDLQFFERPQDSKVKKKILAMGFLVNIIDLHVTCRQQNENKTYFNLLFYQIQNQFQSIQYQLKFYCSDFRYESNGIFVLGWFFFFRQISKINKPFLTIFFLYHSKVIEVLSLNLKRYFTCE